MGKNITIPREHWEAVVKHGCIRSEVEGGHSDEFVHGYRKGVQVALIDLLFYTDKQGRDIRLVSREEISEIEERILRMHFEAKGVDYGEED